MRLFFALQLPPGAMPGLRALQQEVAARAVCARLTAPAHLHLTLAFLGETPPARLAAACAALQALPLGPLPLQLDRVGFFPGERGQLWWAAAAPNPPLEALHSQLAGLLRRQGFTVPARRFFPHITLARGVRPRPGAKPFALPAPLAVCPAAVALMESRLTPAGPVYTCLQQRLLPPPRGRQ